ncbi:MAG TPA: hypothetical protein VGJ00_03965 [Rhabdochlamydiaceae bacterium]|jgi:hypothetical protein
MSYDCYECVIEVDTEDYIDRPQRKEKTTMNDFRSYLNRRVDRVFEDGRITLAKKFFLLEDNPPQTAEALVEVIKSGKYQLPTKDEKTGLTSYGMGPYGIIFRDPANVADPTGFEAALKELKKEKMKALDVINILDEVTSKQALDNFMTYVESLN